ncbi:MAG: hypothetical protein KAI72_06065 [Candidatus Pacebacteria bacterium]|nr:hypothetical protein [Candidatus Paceibacterota bacterium]
MIDVTIPLWMYPILIWTIIWKAVAAWNAARKGHLIWFVAFFVVNTIGILPMVYLFFFQNMNFSAKGRKKVKKRVDKKTRKKKFPVLFK